jgi:ketosteroid isomerase-like protein
MNQEILAANLAAVQVHFDAEKAGDWEKIKTMYTEDIIWERTSTNQIIKGKEAVAAAYGEVFCEEGWDYAFAHRCKS